MSLRKSVASVVVPVSRRCKKCRKTVEASISQNEITCPYCHEVLDAAKPEKNTRVK